MKKTICIILAVVLVAALFVTIMLLTDKDKQLDQNTVETQTTPSLPEIDYYENHASEGITNTSTAPSKNVNMAEGKVVYIDGTEKTWLELYKEQENSSDVDRLFTFVGGTTLVNAFNANETISSIVVPEGIQEFESCFNNNFVSCKITLPSTLETINHTFENAQGAQLITKDNSKMVVIDNVLYTDFGETLLMYPDWKTEAEYVMPDEVKRVAQEAITDNIYLTKITFNQGLEIISKRGITNCPNIVSIELPNTVKTVDSSFSHMYLLESINIPEHCVLEGINFMQCPKLELTVDNTKDYIYENHVLYNKDRTQLIRYMEKKQDLEFTIPDTVQEISPSAFAFNKYLQTLTINEGISVIGTYFAECTELTTVNLPESLKTIKTMTFTRLPHLSNINYAGTIEQWLLINKKSDWIISSIEYKINCSDESIGYKGAA